MGKLKAYKICFDGDRDVYNPGEVVSGYVLIELSEPMKCRGVRIKFEGEAYVNWIESEGSDDDRKSVSSWARKIYLDEVVTLWAHSGGENQKLPAGTHHMPYQLQLPSSGLANSFEGDHGYVRYSIKSNIERPRKSDPKTRAMFTVTGVQVNLNNVPEAIYGQRDGDEMTVCCLCCASGPITMTASIDRSGYTPGEKIKVNIDVDNHSSRSIPKIEATLIQRVKYTAYRGGNMSSPRNKYSKERVSTKSGPGCEPHDKSSWREQFLPIPPIPASGLADCPFIDILYALVCEADVTGTPFGLEVTLPIIIGNIPLQQVYGYDSNSVDYPPIPGGPAPSIEPHPLADHAQATAPLPPPPSYESLYSGQTSVMGANEPDDENWFGQQSFAPR
ncbi:arrestin domain-containing protein 3-like [Ptychodera flava]|uniref:arrestin domain-containing protein 3-like n=1 Tax=Ptychodera flava TaxID=63121 RepID=UPI00396A205C